MMFGCVSARVVSCNFFHNNINFLYLITLSSPLPRDKAYVITLLLFNYWPSDEVFHEICLTHKLCET